LVVNRLNLQQVTEVNTLLNEHDPGYSIGSRNSSGFLSDRAPGGFGSRNSSGYLSDRMMGIGSRNSSGYLSDRSYESDRELERQSGFFMVMGDDIVNQQQEYMYYNEGGDRNGNSFDFFDFTSVPPFNFPNLQNAGGRPPSPGAGGTGEQKSPLV